MNKSELDFKYHYLLKLIDEAAESYTKHGKANIYELQRKAANVRDSNYTFPAKIENYAEYLQRTRHDT